ncbi:MAG: hypothetical protein ACKO54_03770, partial [Alphaproteobacteria bacterium]
MRNFHAARNQRHQRNCRRQSGRHQTRRRTIRHTQRHIAQFKLGDQSQRQPNPADAGAVAGGGFNLGLDARREAPRFQGITFTLAGQAGPLLGGTPGKLPPLGALTFKAGAGDLGWLLPGLRLDALDMIAPPEGEAKLNGSFTRAGNAIRLEASLGEIGKLLQGAEAPLPIEARLVAGGASLTLQGRVARPRELADGQFDLTLDAPDAAGLTGFAILPPGLRGSARLEWRDAQNISLPRLQVTSPALVGTAALTLALADRPSLAGRIDGTRLDLDALSAAPAPSAARPAPAAPAPIAGDGRVIPDVAVPVAPLMALDAELALALRGVTSSSLQQVAVQTNLRLRNGALTL